MANFPPLTLVMIAAVLLMSLWFHLRQFNQHTASHAPTVLTTLGIFGTFLGVAIGLLHFDTGNIQSSVPLLIDGLKTAFWSSIAGLVGALSIKFRYLAYLQADAKNSHNRVKLATVDDLANLLTDIRDQQRAHMHDPRQQELLMELRSLRGEQATSGKRLHQSLDNFLSRAVDANVRALEQVMTDFNSRISEQYGANFKHLNEAIGQMLEWQIQSKDALESLLAKQQNSVELMERATKSHAQVVEQTQVFSHVSEALEGMLQGLDAQSKGLQGYLESLSSLVNQAGEGMPKLEGRFDALTTQLHRSIELNNTHMQDNHTHLAEILTKSETRLERQVESILLRGEQQLVQIDEGLERELNNALRSFGYQLASLSEKFVSDYSPLTERLQELVSLAETKAPAPSSEQSL